MSYWRPTHPDSGDTIVEVLISMTILALVLAVTFVSTSHSLQTGTDATNRQQATSYAQQQIADITDYVNSGGSLSSNQNQKFCFPTSGENADKLTVLNDTNTTDCITGQYTTTENYNNGLVNVSTTWAGSTSSGGQTNQLTLYYRVENP